MFCRSNFGMCQVLGQSMGIPIPFVLTLFSGMWLAGATHVAYGKAVWMIPECFAYWNPVVSVFSGLLLALSTLMVTSRRVCGVKLYQRKLLVGYKGNRSKHEPTSSRLVVNYHAEISDNMIWFTVTPHIAPKKRSSCQTYGPIRCALDRKGQRPTFLRGSGTNIDICCWGERFGQHHFTHQWLHEFSSTTFQLPRLWLCSFDPLFAGVSMVDI